VSLFAFCVDLCATGNQQMTMKTESYGYFIFRIAPRKPKHYAGNMCFTQDQGHIDILVTNNCCQ